MNIGFSMCVVLVPFFLGMALLFGVMKGNSAKLVAGFNMLPKEEQELYDKEWIAKDLRNSCLVWTGVMVVGAILSYFVSGYAAIVAYVVWLILFFKEVHIDARKAYEKYKIK